MIILFCLFCSLYVLMNVILTCCLGSAIPTLSATVFRWTLDGRDMSLLVIGEPEEGKKVIIGLQLRPLLVRRWKNGFIEGFSWSACLERKWRCGSSLLIKLCFCCAKYESRWYVRGHFTHQCPGVTLNREWGLIPASGQKVLKVFYVNENARNGCWFGFFKMPMGEWGFTYNFVAVVKVSWLFSSYNLEDKL